MIGVPWVEAKRGWEGKVRLCRGWCCGWRPMVGCAVGWCRG